MLADLMDELMQGSKPLLFFLVPRLEDRIPITWKTYPITLAFLGPVTFMAYLARRPNTHLLRLIMLPVTIAMTLHCCFGYVWIGKGMSTYNWGEGLVGLAFIGKALDYALSKDGIFKLEELESKKKRNSEKNSDSEFDVSGHYQAANGHATEQRKRNSGLYDALELLISNRGIGWDFGKGVYIPPERKPLERRAFLIATFESFVVNFMILDIMESFFKLVPGVGSLGGGSIFLPTLPPLQRYTLSTLIHSASGIALLAGFQMVYDLCTLLAVGILNNAPASWPPVIDKPFSSVSLHEYWAKRWHQLLRQTFIVFGGIPGRWIGGPIGLVMGAFLASGLFHECSSITMARGWDIRVPAFFLFQGLLVCGERVWRNVTGKRVGGWPGRIWVYFVIFVLGQPMTDAWHIKGLGGGLILPPVISPTRQIFFPLISKLTVYELDTYHL